MYVLQSISLSSLDQMVQVTWCGALMLHLQCTWTQNDTLDIVDSRNGSPDFRVSDTEDNHEEFNWIWTSWCWWRYRLFGMNQSILQVSSEDVFNWASTKRVREESSQARQYEYHQDGEGRRVGLRGKNKKHSHSIFLCNRKSEGRNNCCNLLSKKRNGSWLPFQTITR